MKKYKVTLKCSETKKIISEFEEVSNTKKYLIHKYEMKVKFDNPKTKVIVERLRKKPGVQLNIIDELEKI